MTVLGSVACCNHVLIASDSEATSDDGARLQRLKLWPVEGRPIVWGYADHEATGQRFRDWINEAQIPQHWSAFLSLAHDKLGELNMGANESARKFGLGSGTTTASILIAAFFDGMPHIARLEDDSSILETFTNGVALLGGGVAWADPISVRATHCRLADFSAMMQKTAYSAEMCGPPIQMWEITCEGAAKVDLPPYAPSLL